MHKRQNEHWIITALAIALLIAIIALVIVWTQLRAPARAHEAGESVEARVIRVIDTQQFEIAPGQFQPVQRVQAEILSGAQRGARVEAEYGAPTASAETTLHAGDHVLMTVALQPDGEPLIVITDWVRTGALAFLGGMFLIVAIGISGWKGLRALIGLAFSFVVLIGFVLPQILAGNNPVVVSIIGSFVLLAVTLYLIDGWQLKTHVAIAGVLVSLILTGALTLFATQFTRLTGFGSEDAMFLAGAGIEMDLRGLLLAGIIVGTLGVLDDVVVSQASVVMELAEMNPGLTWRELYRRAMHVGHDHIASTINTLVLAYVGASMPMWLLFQINPEPWHLTLNREVIAEEIVRTLVGSTGLIAAVPIATLIASIAKTKMGSAKLANPRE